MLVHECLVGAAETAAPPDRSFCVFCEFRGRTLRSLTICVHLCASVGGFSPPEASVNSVNSVGEPYAA